MKLIQYTILFCVIPLTFLSCGGVIGSIKKYEFPNLTTHRLKSALKHVYVNYPNLIKSDSMYGKTDDNDFYYCLNKNGEKIVFLCNVSVYEAPYDKQPELSLTSATKWGTTLNLAPDMSYFEKRKYRLLFEEEVLPKIKKELIQL